MSKRRRCVMPLTDWPAADMAAWEAALRPGDMFEDAGGAAHLSASSRANTVNAYGRFLQWLHGQPRLHDNSPIATRVTQEVIGAYVPTLQAQYASSTVRAHLASLVVAVKAMAPEHDWAWLNKVVARLRRLAVPARDKRARLRPVGDLRDLGLALMDTAEGEAGPLTWERATAFRDGLMISLLAARPLRRRNFSSIRIGEHLVPVGDGYALRFSGAETKNGRPLDYAFPDFLLPRLARYLSTYRPWLMAQTAWRDPRFAFREAGNSLWVSKCGSAMQPGPIFNAVKARTEAQFGIGTGLHLFRDCVGTSVAVQDPGHVEIIQRLLGHASPTTAEKFYTHAHSIEASRLMQENIMKIRRT